MVATSKPIDSHQKKKTKKTKTNKQTKPIYTFADSSSKAKTKIGNKPNLKKKPHQSSTTTINGCRLRLHLKLEQRCNNQ